MSEDTKPKFISLNTKIYDYQDQFLKTFSKIEEKSQADVVRAVFDYFIKHHGGH